MFIQAEMAFASNQALTGTADVVSTNVHNAGAAKKLFAGSGERPKVPVVVTAVGGTTPAFRARLVAADDAALATNPEILADTGVSKVLAAGDLPLVYELQPNNQKAAKQYYGVIFTLAGTAPTATASANVVMDGQSNLLK